MSNYKQTNLINSIPTVTRNILIINFIVWLACNVFDKTQYNLTYILGLHYFQSDDFHFYQVITYMFTHNDFFHLFFNMFAVFMFGIVLERTWGTKRFLTYYLLTGIGAAIVQMLVSYLRISSMTHQLSIYASTATQVYDSPLIYNIQSIVNSITIGASGAVFGILIAFGMTFPNAPMMVLFFPVPIKAKYLVLAYGVIELFSGIANRSGDNIAHFAHLGGAFSGLLIFIYWGKGKDIARIGRFLEEKWKKIFKKKPTMHISQNRFESEYDYNARKNVENKEIDMILDKVKKSGYNSLSSEEKQKLFDASSK